MTTPPELRYASVPAQRPALAVEHRTRTRGERRWQRRYAAVVTTADLTVITLCVAIGVALGSGLGYRAMMVARLGSGITAWLLLVIAALAPYHASFRSCNKAFYTERARRLAHWCGQCDKCCFIDLILAPFLPAEALRRIFAATGEPLDDPGLAPKFRSLLGAGAKPFECVGEVTECRAAVLLAARRDDRAGRGLLAELAAEVAGWPDAPSEAEAAAMLRPVGRNFIPNEYR